MLMKFSDLIFLSDKLFNPVTIESIE